MKKKKQKQTQRQKKSKETGKKKPPLWAVALISVAVLLGAAGVFWILRGPNLDEKYPQMVAAGNWLRPYVDRNTVIYAGTPVAPRHAEAKYREFPSGTYEEILDTVVREKGDFLVAQEKVLEKIRPQLVPLALDKPTAWFDPRLQPVYVERTKEEGPIVVFRVLRPGGRGPLPSEATIRKKMALLGHNADHLFHARLALRKKLWSAAAGEYAWAVRADSTLTEGFHNRAMCLMKAGFGQQNAESDARVAVSREPENTDYLKTLVDVLEWVGKPEEAAMYRARMDSLLAEG